MRGAVVADRRGAAVAVRGLVKRFKQVGAVDDVSFEVAPGEFLALLGPSGSGKTTILMIIAGFETPTAGTVWMDGVEATRIPSHRRGIGFVFQRYALFPHMTVAENIAFPLKMRGVPPRERVARVDDALAMVRLSGYGDRRPHQLSGGQQQRVALARVIAYRPPVLLMDEPLGALDRKLREEMQLEIKHLQQRLGTTVIYVTHDQQEALTMADRVAVLHDGRLQQIGRPADIYDCPANAFVADFVGETNFLDGRAVHVDGDRVEVAAGELRAPAVLPRGVGRLPPGTPVRLGVRPEHVRLDPPADIAAGWPGRVREVLTRGPSVTCIVEIGAQTIAATLPRAEAAGPGWQPGEAVRVWWRPEHARVYVQTAERRGP